MADEARPRRRDGALRCLLVGGLLAVACSSGSLVLGRVEESTGAPTADSGHDALVSPVGEGSADVCGVPVPERHYPFDGKGTVAVDARGGQEARLLGGAALDGSGAVHLDGIDDYVDLPNGLLAGHEEVTIAVWVRRLGGPSAYKRIVDIGSTREGEDPPLAGSNAGETYLAVATGTGNVPSGLAVLMSAGGPPGESVALSDVVLDKELHFVAVSVAKDSVSLYYDGVLTARVRRAVPLEAIVDVNAWLGRSQYSADGYFEGDYSDLRVYDRAVDACEVRAMHAEGASPP